MVTPTTGRAPVSSTETSVTSETPVSASPIRIGSWKVARTPSSRRRGKGTGGISPSPGWPSARKLAVGASDGKKMPYQACGNASPISGAGLATPNVAASRPACKAVATSRSVVEFPI